MNYRSYIILIGFILFVSLDIEAQCAMCRAVLESGEDQSAAEGINDGIIYLMAIPYILVGSIGFFIYRKYNKASKAKNNSDSP